MEEEKEETELLQKAKERLEADNKKMPEESPLEKAERLNREIKRMLERTEKLKSDYETARANDQMSGRGVITLPPKTQQELDREAAKGMAKDLLG